MVIGENPWGLIPRKPGPAWFGTRHLLKPEWAIMADGAPRNPLTDEEDRENGELP